MSEEHLSTMRLTVGVKRFLDYSYLLVAAGLIIWAIAVVVIGVNISSEPNERHTDIHFLLGFKVFQNAEGMAELAGQTELIEGRGDIKVNNSKSHFAWYLSNAINEVMGLLALYGLFIARKIFSLLVEHPPVQNWLVT